jgi:hypothetical protein
LASIRRRIFQNLYLPSAKPEALYNSTLADTTAKQNVLRECRNVLFFHESYWADQNADQNSAFTL